MSRPKVPVPQPMEPSQRWRQAAEQEPEAQAAEPEPTYWPRQGGGQPPVHETYSIPPGSADPVHLQQMHEAAALASYTPPPHQSAYETRLPPQSAGSGFGAIQPLPGRAQNAHVTSFPPQASGDTPPLPNNPYGRLQDRFASVPYDQDGPPALQSAPGAHEAGYTAQAAPPQPRRNLSLDQWAAAPPPPPPPDAHNYHLDRYVPAVHGQDFGAAASSGETQWAHGRDTYGLQVGEPSSDVTNYGMPQTALEPVQAGSAHIGYEPEEDLDNEPEERRRTPRLLIVAGALVGAIALGGGLAYTYKLVMGPAAKSVPPIIKADNKPTKVPPAEPGGKQFAHKDSKLMGRLGDDGDGVRTASAGSAATGPASAPAAAEADASGPRRVTTLPVGRDGALLMPPQSPVAAPPSIVVPGTSVVIEGNPVQGSLAPATAPVVTSSMPPPVSSQAPAVRPSPTKPQVIAKAPPPAADPDQATAESPAAAPSRKIVPRQAPPVAAAAPAADPAPRPAVGGGFVAVLASQKSRIDALKTFADMQQKYGGVLQNKEPAVQEADLSARGLGIVYRVGVGPPGSREAANEVCTRLKAAGHSGCWVSAF